MGKDSVIWTEIILEGIVERQQIRDAVARALKVARESVFVVADIAEASSNGVVCQMEHLATGVFQTVLQIYALETEIHSDVPSFVSALSTLLNRSCLMSDDSVDPYVMKQVFGETSELVSLNQSMLEEGFFEIERKGTEK